MRSFPVLYTLSFLLIAPRCVFTLIQLSPHIWNLTSTFSSTSLTLFIYLIIKGTQTEHMGKIKCNTNILTQQLYYFFKSSPLILSYAYFYILIIIFMNTFATCFKETQQNCWFFYNLFERELVSRRAYTLNTYILNIYAIFITYICILQIYM